MRNGTYYEDRLFANKLLKCYEIAPHRIKQYLDAEIQFVGNISRSDKPLIFSTEIASSFEDVGENIKEEIKLSEEELKALDKDTLLRLRKLFKRRLHGMINVRTNGEELCAARRVKASWCWESYGGIAPTPRSVK